MEQLIPMLLVGGPLHGNWTAAPARTEGQTYYLPEIEPLRIVAYGNDPRLSDPAMKVHTYRVTNLGGTLLLLHVR